MYDDDNTNYHILLSLHVLSSLHVVHLPKLAPQCILYIYCILEVESCRLCFLVFYYNIMLWGTLHIRWQ